MKGSRTPSVWQISGGPVDRPYAEIFLMYGVALLGPSGDGPWRPERSHRAGRGFLSLFVQELEVGDLLLLRTAVDAIAAIGLVAGEYEYLEPFDDVNGWDLRHGRRVRWYRLPEAYRFEDSGLGANPMRCSRVQSPEAVAYARSFLVSGLTRWQEAPLPALPSVEAPLGEVPANLRDVVGMARDLAGLYGDEDRMGAHPSENEMIAHFAVPFLRALGWPPENIAVEWRRIDIALFHSLPRTPESCRFVIEAKRLGTGLEGARKQAKAYVKRLGSRRDMVVTDGFRYRVFDCERSFEPVGYANLARLKQSSLALFNKLRWTKE